MFICTFYFPFKNLSYKLLFLSILLMYANVIYITINEALLCCCMLYINYVERERELFLRKREVRTSSVRNERLTPKYQTLFARFPGRLQFTVTRSSSFHRASELFLVLFFYLLYFFLSHNDQNDFGHKALPSHHDSNDISKNVEMCAWNCAESIARLRLGNPQK